MQSIRKRIPGTEQPHVKLGMFHLRLPFLHYGLEVPEMLTGIANGVCCFGGTAVMVTVLGVPAEVATIAMILCTLTYILHVTAGDAVICGWITPSIPLTTMFLMNFEMGTDRIQAMIALQLLVGAIFLFMGITGLANKIVGVVPTSIKGGIVLGAAISAVFGEFKTGGRFHSAPITVGVCAVLAIYLLYSLRFKDQCARGPRFLLGLSKLSIIPALIVAAIIGPIAGEIAYPAVSLFPLFRIPDFGLAMGWLSPFCIGWPPLTTYLQAFPMACAVYIIAFGDLVTSKALTHEADMARTDEYLDINLNRLNFVAGVRNILLGLFCTFLPFAGPFGAPYTISTLQRYKGGEKNMYSLMNGMASNCIFAAITVCVIPLSEFILPIAGSLLSVMVMIQGFSCTSVGFNLCRDEMDIMIAGVIAGLMAAQGAAWGLGIGILIYFVIANRKKLREDFAYNREELRVESERQAGLREISRAAGAAER